MPTPCWRVPGRASRPRVSRSQRGVDAAVTAATLVLPYNDLAAVDAALRASRRRDRGRHRRAGGREHGRRAARAGLPRRPARHHARPTARCSSSTRSSRASGSARPAAQARFGVTPDLTVLGKVIGGGLPIGAFGGRRTVMGLLAPDGSGLPGRHAVGTSAGHGRRCRDACARDPSCLRAPGAPRESPRVGPSGPPPPRPTASACRSPASARS